MTPPRVHATLAAASGTPKLLTSYKPFWAKRFGTAPFLPMSRSEMEQLGWDSCDVILVTGDAYVDHPSFGMAVIGRVLEAQGFRVGIIAQPDWHSAEPFKALGRPNLFWGVTAGNMDSMINRYTADRKIRSDDAYTPGGMAGSRPDRAAVVYSQRCREAYKDVPVILGGIEGSLRRGRGRRAGGFAGGRRGHRRRRGGRARLRMGRSRHRFSSGWLAPRDKQYSQQGRSQQGGMEAHGRRSSAVGQAAQPNGPP